MNAGGFSFVLENDYRSLKGVPNGLNRSEEITYPGQDEASKSVAFHSLCSCHEGRDRESSVGVNQLQFPRRRNGFQ